MPPPSDRNDPADRPYPPPIPLTMGYARPGMARPGRSKPASLFTGLTVGVILSAIVWFTGFRFASNSQAIVIVALSAIGLKYLMAIVLVCFRDWRSFALGLFISLPIGAVIFFGACAASL